MLATTALAHGSIALASLNVACLTTRRAMRWALTFAAAAFATAAATDAAILLAGSHWQ